MWHELVDEDYPDEGNSSSTVLLNFTDGSPYWPPAEDTASSREARNDSYQRALTYYSATHSPSADSTGSPPFVENESETSSAFNSDQQASKSLAPPPPTRPPPKPPSSPDQSFQRPLSEVQPSLEHPSHRASKGWHLFPSGALIHDDSEDTKPILNRVYQEMVGNGTGWQETQIPLTVEDHNNTPSPEVFSDFGQSKVQPLAYIPPFKHPKHLQDAIAETLAATTDQYITDTRGFRDGDHRDGVDLAQTPQATPDFRIPDSHFLDPMQKARYLGGCSVGSSLTNISPTTTPWRRRGPTAHLRNSQETSDDSSSVPWTIESPRQDSCHTLHSTPAAHSRGFFPTGHSGHGIASITQPSNTNVLSSRLDPRKTAGSASRSIDAEKPGKLECRKSASDLAADWDSLNVGLQPARSQTLADTRQPTHRLQRPATKSNLANLHDAYRQDSSARRDTFEPKSRYWTPGWIRSLIGMPEPYKTKLTDMPKRTTVRRQEPSDNLGVLTGRSATVGTIGRNIKDEVNKMEHLVSEATDLASQTAGCEDHERLDNSGLAGMGPKAATPHPNYTHERRLDESETTDDRTVVRMQPAQKVAIRALTKDTIKTPIRRRPLPKHFPSMPGILIGNIGVNIPRRSSSLLKETPNSAGGLKVPSSRLVAHPSDVCPSGWAPPTE